MKTKRAKRPITYSEAHNRAVRMYHRTSIFLLWAGVMSLFASVLGVIQISAGTIVEGAALKWPTSGFSLGLSIEMLFYSMLIKSNLDLAVIGILIILIGILFGGMFALIGIFASKGYRWVLFVGTGLYALDFAASFFIFAYSDVPSIFTNYMLTIFIHIFILAACVVAIIEYYNVLHIEKVFSGKSDKKANIEEEVESEVIANGE